jgi:cell division protein FtsN
MSNKTNEDKLKILQERLTQIKKKQENTSSSNDKKSDVSSNKIYIPQKEKTKISFGSLKYVVTVCILLYISFYAYNNLNLQSLNSNEGENKVSKIAEIEKTEIELKYNLELEGNSIVIAGSFTDQSSAKAMTNYLKIKGYKSDYFYLPYKSNSKDEVYKVFIGPYENLEETNQWANNLEEDYEIIIL